MAAVCIAPCSCSTLCACSAFETWRHKVPRVLALPCDARQLDVAKCTYHTWGWLPIPFGFAAELGGPRPHCAPRSCFNPTSYSVITVPYGCGHKGLMQQLQQLLPSGSFVTGAVLTKRETDVAVCQPGSLLVAQRVGTALWGHTSEETGSWWFKSGGVVMQYIRYISPLCP